jgi:hypothetical protein
MTIITITITITVIRGRVRGFWTLEEMEVKFLAGENVCPQARVHGVGQVQGGGQRQHRREGHQRLDYQGK